MGFYFSFLLSLLLYFFFLFLPPTPNPLINAFKPTHCAGWVCFFISHHAKRRDPWNAVLTLTHNYPEELLGLKRLAP